MYIDTHAHLYLKHFRDDIEKVVHDALRKEVTHIYLPNIDSNSATHMKTLQQRYPDMFSSMMGLHPGSVKEDFEKELALVYEELSTGRYIGVGEIGTDLYWDTSFKEQQIIAFEQQIRWAQEFDLPIIIHARNSMDLTIDIVSKYQDGNLRGIFHCFTGNSDQAERIMELGFFMGVGGIITYKKSGLKEVLKDVPLDFLVLETDAPFLPPVPHRGRRNESAYIAIIAQHLAEAQRCAPAEIAESTTSNARKVFEST